MRVCQEVWILNARMRKGSANTARGAHRFVSETVARVRRAGATGEVVMRFDSGYWSNDTMALLARLDVRFTMAVKAANVAIAAAISTIDESAWVDIGYTPDGEAQVAETAYTSGRGAKQTTRRLIVRRTRLVDPAQQALWPHWRHHAFLTDLTDSDPTAIDAFHRGHATVELAIKDLKANGLEHVPSGNFSANGAWLACAVLAHNLTRWAVTLGDIAHPQPTRRRPNHPHPPHRHARPPRQPGRHPHPAPPHPLALGPRVQPRPHQPAPTPPRAHLNSRASRPAGPGAPADQHPGR